MGTDCPRAQKEASSMLSESALSSATSPSAPFPAAMRVRISMERQVPTRQGVHFPQDSAVKKCSNSRRKATGDTDWSQTRNEPAPSEIPFEEEAKSIVTSSRLLSTTVPPAP